MFGAGVKEWSGVTKRDSRLAQIVGSDLHIHFVTDADPDKILPHLAGDVGEYFVAVGKSHSEHRAREYLGDRALQCDRFFFCHALR